MNAGFSLDNESSTHYTLKHPKGDVLKIAKQGLSDAMHGHIKRLAKGGEVKPAANPISEGFNNATGMSGIKQASDNIVKTAGYSEGTGPEGAQPQDATQPTQAPVTINIHSGGDGVQRQPQAMGNDPRASITQIPRGQNISAQSPEAEAPQAPQIQQGGGAPQAMAGPQGVGSPGALPNLGGQYQQAIGNIEQGASGEAKVKGAIGNQQAALFHQQAVEDYKFNQMIARNAQETNDHLQALAQDYNDKKLDFNQVWHDKGTGQKVMAGIGMLLSGFGSGLTGQPNMALKVINDEIERDMKAQLANKESKKTAFEMYQKVYGNKEHALMAQKLDAQALVALKINEMISKSAGPMAEAQKQLYLGQMLPQLQKGAYDFALQRAGDQYMMGTDRASQQLTSGEGGGMQPASAVAPEQMKVEGDSKAESGPSTSPSLGRTGRLDMQKFNGLQRVGWMPKDDKEAATKEAAIFQEAQTTKSLVLKDLMQMKDAIRKNKEYGEKATLNPMKLLKGDPLLTVDPLALQHLQESAQLPWPFEHLTEPIKDADPILGDKESREIQRQYRTAKASALNKLNVHLTKRIGGEGMKNIKLTLPEQTDEEQEIDEKIARVMMDLDTTTATPTLDRYGLIKR